MQQIAMHPSYIRCWISAALLLVVATGGCATRKDTVLPQDGPSMREIYDEHFGTMSRHSIDGARAALAERTDPAAGARRVEPEELDLAGYTRSVYDEIDARFPRLPNPTLVMYVFPHLAGPEAAPVPGYATTFPLYEGVEYALPGEVARYGQP